NSRRFRPDILPLRWLSEITKPTMGWFTGFVLAACMMFGGATRSGSLGDVVLQFVSVVLLILALRAIGLSSAWRSSLRPLAFVGLIVFVPIIQLIPLPLTVWTLLPGRDVIAETYALIGRPQPSSPITLTPDATWLGALALLPAVAIFISVLTLDWPARRNLSW